VVRLHAVVHGDVQGVGYRYFVLDRARPLGVLGWVRNRDDGSVEIVAEAERDRLDALLESARRGPRHAAVIDVSVDWSEATGDLRTFEIVA
jgi:acylphosphatase